MNEVRVGFLSAVRHMAGYAGELAGLPGIRLVGVAEDAEGTKGTVEAGAAEWIVADSAAAAAAHGLPFETDVARFLARDDVDAVVVCSEPTRHTALAVAALRAGKHVLVDKPLATSVAEVDLLEAALAQSTGTLSVINRNQAAALRRLRGWVDAGHLGLPLHVDAEWFASGAYFATSVERPELVVDPALSGGGELLNFLLYPIDYIREVTGLGVVEVYAESATLFSELHRDAGVEDTVIASLLLERGVTASVTVGRIPAAPGLGPTSMTLRVLGSHGNASTDDDRPQVRWHGLDGGVSALPCGGPGSESAVRAMLADWVDTLRQGRPPTYSLADARATLEVVFAAARSARLGQPVRLEGAR